ncbi:hypothetical protein H106_04319 [Trichophyton rubrum CBS 735.88]|nr:hypothetical protein H106_04319 [Trichophyton rubrum CBS 735.88]
MSWQTRRCFLFWLELPRDPLFQKQTVKLKTRRAEVEKKPEREERREKRARAREQESRKVKRESSQSLLLSTFIFYLLTFSLLNPLHPQPGADHAGIPYVMPTQSTFSSTQKLLRLYSSHFTLLLHLHPPAHP